MRLSDLMSELRQSGVDVELRPRQGQGVDTGAGMVADIADVVHDSRRADRNTLFCAVPGETVDGHDFAAQAVGAGATALLVERWLQLDVDQVRTPNVRRAMPHAAAAVHGHPSRSLQIVGITGTNGKTTTTELLSSVLRTAGHDVASIGTLHGGHTTPEAPELQRRLRTAVEAGATMVAAEVSSHALAQHRADAVRFAVAAFTNLTPDHLDFHHDMASYFEAKCRLFDGRADHELVNTDDPWGARLAEMRPGATRVRLADVSIIDSSLAGTEFDWRGQRVRLPLPGMMNVANALMAAEAARVVGLSDDQIAAGLSQAPMVPGRMQLVDDPTGRRTVVVDYSHTPDSIERALRTLRAVDADAELTIVFGCGGDRDRAKRPLMARAAEAADRVIITSDNPRSEDPDAIIDEAMSGFSTPELVHREADRARAIELAIDGARSGGVVLIAGKGHERTQTIGNQTVPFDDVAVAAAALEGVAS